MTPELEQRMRRIQQQLQQLLQRQVGLRQRGMMDARQQQILLERRVADGEAIICDWPASPDSSGKEQA